MSKVVVTGATGFIGAPLMRALVDAGHAVTAISRDGARATAQLGVPAETANLEERGWGSALAGADAVVHLAGEPIAAKRWDARQKQRIRDSRVEATRVLVEELAALPAERRPGALISTSGTDVYPFALPPLDDDEVTEADPPSESFLGRVCRDWEKEARGAEALGLRVAIMRNGLVLGGGGALAKLTTPFKLFAGGRIASGAQWVSWIHLDDTVAAYAAAVGDARYRGAFNLVTDSVRNADFSRAVGRALGRPSWLPVPRFALNLAVGELAEYLVAGRRVVPAHLRDLGFAWRHPDLDDALVAALGGTDQSPERPTKRR
jgi:uncharacterized protein